MNKEPLNLFDFSGREAATLVGVHSTGRVHLVLRQLQHVGAVRRHPEVRSLWRSHIQTAARRITTWLKLSPARYATARTSSPSVQGTAPGQYTATCHTRAWPRAALGRRGRAHGDSPLSVRRCTFVIAQVGLLLVSSASAGSRLADACGELWSRLIMLEPLSDKLEDLGLPRLPAVGPEEVGDAATTLPASWVPTCSALFKAVRGCCRWRVIEQSNEWCSGRALMRRGCPLIRMRRSRRGQPHWKFLVCGFPLTRL